MVDRKEPGLDQDGLESLSLEPQGRVAAPVRSEAANAESSGRGGSFLLTLILLLLVAAGGYLGYMLVQQQTVIEELKLQLNQELGQTQARVESLEATLALTSDSAEQSGQTLQQRLQELNVRAKEKFTHYDSEIAKLWTLAYQRNKPQLEQQAEQLDSLSKQLAAAEKSLTETRAQANKASQELTALAAIKAQQASLEKQFSARIDSLGRQLDTFESSLKLESEGRLKVQQELAEQLTQLQGDDGQTAELAQRIRQNEQAIKAIDGTRRQLSQDLLRIRQQLNNLQLRLEQSS